MRLTTKTTKKFYNIVVFLSCFSGQANPPLTRNCDREDSVNDDHCLTTKTTKKFCNIVIFLSCFSGQMGRSTEK